MLLNFLLLLIGFTALILGANWLVNGASSFSRRLGISELMIGLTVVAFGTSTPELVVNIVASNNGLSEVVLGNVIGSNIFNLLLILGISGTILPIIVQRNTVWLEIPISFFATVLLLSLAIFGHPEKDPQIGFWEGIILLAGFAGFMFYIFKNIKSEKQSETSGSQQPILISIALIIAGLAGLVIGGKIVVKESTEIASYFGMSEKLIGLTIVSIGTSLPELATSVVAALRKNTDMAIGNIIGSNIFNILLILGICAVNNPVKYTLAFNADIILLGSFTFLLFIAMFTGVRKKLDRWEAVLLFMTFIGYMIYIIQRN